MTFCSNFNKMHSEIKDFLFFNNCSLAEKYAFKMQNFNVKELILRFIMYKVERYIKYDLKGLFLNTYTNLFGDRVEPQHISLSEINEELQNPNDMLNLIDYAIDDKNVVFKDSVRNGKSYLFETQNVFKYLLYIFFNRYGKKITTSDLKINSLLEIKWVINIEKKFALNKNIDLLYVNGITSRVSVNNNNNNNIINTNFLKNLFNSVNTYNKTKEKYVDFDVYLEIMFKSFRTNLIFLFDVYSTLGKKIENFNFSHLYFLNNDKNIDVSIKNYIFYDTFYDNYFNIISNINRFYEKSSIIIKKTNQHFTLGDFFEGYSKFIKEKNENNSNNNFPLVPEEISIMTNFEFFKSIFQTLQNSFVETDYYNRRVPGEYNTFAFLNLPDIEVYMKMCGIIDFLTLDKNSDYSFLKTRAFLSKFNSGNPYDENYCYVEIIFKYKKLNYYDYEIITNEIIKNLFFYTNDNGKEVNLLFDKYKIEDLSKFNYLNAYNYNNEYNETKKYKNLILINEIENINFYSLNVLLNQYNNFEFAKSFSIETANYYFGNKEVDIYKHIYKHVVIKNFQDFLLVFFVLVLENQQMLSLTSSLEFELNFKIKDNIKSCLKLICTSSLGKYSNSLISNFSVEYETLNELLNSFNKIDKEGLNIVSFKICDIIEQIRQNCENTSYTAGKKKEMIYNYTEKALKRFFCTCLYHLFTKFKFDENEKLDIYSFSYFMVSLFHKDFIFLKLSSIFEYNVYDIINISKLKNSSSVTNNKIYKSFKIEFIKSIYYFSELKIKRENFNYYYCHDYVFFRNMEENYGTFLMNLIENKIEKTNPETYVEPDKIGLDISKYIFYCDYYDGSIELSFLIVDLDDFSIFYFCFKDLNIQRQDLENAVNKVISDTFFGSDNGYIYYKLNADNIHSNHAKKLKRNV